MSRIVCSSRPTCSRIGTMMFSVTLSEENRAPSWNCTPVRACIARSALPCRVAVSTPSISMVPLVCRLRPMMVRSSTDLPVPDPPTRPTISPRNTSKSRLSWMMLSPNCVRTPRSFSTTSRPSRWSTSWPPSKQLGRRGLLGMLLRRGGGIGHHTFASRKMIENIASSTITQKIDSTTDLVVSWPTLSALPRTCRPSKQPMMAITAPNTGALIMPT